MTYPTKEEKLHPGACTCPACSPDLWAAGIKGSKTPGECNEGLDQSRECTSNAGLGSSPPAPVTSNGRCNHWRLGKWTGTSTECPWCQIERLSQELADADARGERKARAAARQVAELNAVETFGKEPWRVALPKITEQHTADFIGYRSLMEFKGSKWEWTQDAVDFACMLQGVRQEAMRPEEPSADGLTKVRDRTANVALTCSGACRYSNGVLIADPACDTHGSAQKAEEPELCPRCQQSMPGGVALHTDHCPQVKATAPHVHVWEEDGLYEGAICKCGARADGWYCPDSPDHLCHYGKGNFDQCDHCGQPEERK